MLTRGGRKQGADEQTLHDDEGGAGLLQKDEDGEGDGDAEGEGAGLLPMDPEKTLALVACPLAILFTPRCRFGGYFHFCIRLQFRPCCSVCVIVL